MKIIVGLGNPGKKYENTRHNVGFLGLDKIVIKLKVESHKVEDFKYEKKFEAEIVKLKMGKEDIVLVKPQTFMNNSGEAVQKVVSFYKINPEKDLIVIYDDVDIPLGKVRIRSEGSSAGHRGLQSIIDALGTERFMRVRLGIGRPASPDASSPRLGEAGQGGPSNELVKIEDWVLQKLPDVEKDVLFNVIEDLIMNGLQYLAL